MNKTKVWLGLALVLAVVGGFLFAHPGDGEVVFGFVSSSTDGSDFPGILFLTTRCVVGIVMIWLATLIAAGLLTLRIQRARSAS